MAKINTYIACFLFMIISPFTYAEIKDCDGYTTTAICTQVKHGEGEFLEIRAGNGTTLGDQNNHFSITGEGYSLYNPQAHFRVQVVSGIVNYMDVNKSYFMVIGSTGPNGETISYAKADNTYLYNSLMWVESTADNTTSKGNSLVMVTTQLPYNGSPQYDVNNDGTIWNSPVINNSSYHDKSEEILWGVKVASKGWDTVATSNNSNFYKNSNQLISGNGRSYNASFHGESVQKITTDGEASGEAYDSIFDDYSTQYLYANTKAINTILNSNSKQYLLANTNATNTILNDKSVSTVYSTAKQTGTTTVNKSAQLILVSGNEDKTAVDTGAYAENVVLSDQESKLVIASVNSGSSGNTAFAGSISGNGNVYIAKDSSGNFNNLIADNISGSETYKFATDVGGKKSSLLIINSSSSGAHIVTVNNNGSIATKGTEKVVIVKDNSGKNAKGTFSSGTFELGGYLYHVARDGDTNNWAIVGGEATDTTNTTEPTKPSKPTISVSAKTITGLASTSYLMTQAEISTLNQRMGDLTKSKKTGTGKISGAWGRTYSGNYKTSENDKLAKADANYYGFQLGVDANTVHYGENTNYLGVFIGNATSKSSYESGDATVTSWYGGLYDAFIMNNGFHIDSVIKFGRYSNNYNLKDTQDNAVNGKENSNVISLSSQIGKRFTLKETDNYNVYAEPQAQLTYSHIGAFNTKASNNLRVEQSAYNSTIARIGILLGTRINKQSDVYLKTSYMHEFGNDINYTLNNSSESYSVKSGGFEAGLGVNVKLNDNSYLYAEADYINSKDHYTGSKFNIGYRYSF